MKIKQLGNGGAFDYDKTNSSFLIDIGTEEKRSLILFDCGYNVFSKLRELEKEDKDIIKDIDLIWISHLDDDHIGSLKTLIYYRYYILGKETIIIRNSLESELKNFLSDMNQTMKFGKFIETNILYIVDKSFINIKNKTFVLNQIETFHHLDCYGLCVKEINNETNEYTSILYISGDTKVCSGTIEALNDIVQSIGTLKNYKIYHDYSNWNSYENNVHTCEYDFNKYYLQNDTFKDLEITKYHNNAEFDENWVEI
jgi:phosphoribosyl 1,2-cyclic phosphodiesterase